MWVEVERMSRVDVEESWREKKGVFMLHLDKCLLRLAHHPSSIIMFDYHNSMHR